jgi:peptidoglycan/xylan/chitin deacetylase (PgdA/CDA1 family)
MSAPLHQAALPLYRQLRQLKNRVLNRIDPPVVVLIYHRVTLLPSDPHLLAVSPENFRAQMRFLKRDFQLVRFEEDWSDLKGPAVAVTFDDGYADNALEALPILEEVGIPATFFVSTGNLDTLLEYWWDELERIILGDRSMPESFTLRDSRFERTWPTVTLEDREELYRKIHLQMMKLDPAGREDWLMQLRRWAQLDETGREAYRAMTDDELRCLAGSKWVTIGAHTVTHTPLSTLSAEQQRREIFSSKHQLETLLGKAITVFSYPFGRKNDYNRVSVQICRELGFIKAASNFPGQVHRWTDSYQLPRQLVRNWDIDTFASRVKDFWV